MIEFSVVIAVYNGDVPSYFEEALNSLLTQDLLPKEIIIVRNGPLDKSFDSVFESALKEKRIRVVNISTNKGPGVGRHVGIVRAKTPLVAIMDADDIAARDRFSKQVQCFDNGSVDFVGGIIEEFSKLPGDIKRLRIVPKSHNEISKLGRWRYPMNHVTLMFLRESYINIGGYGAYKVLEDYDLFHRAIMGGLRFQNLDSLLVYVRSGSDLIGRRSGLAYLTLELRLLDRMRRSGYLNLHRWLLNVLIRCGVRLLPQYLLTKVYDVVRVKR
jgi:glycosyltransferase involved in cell wall biosynthesis